MQRRWVWLTLTACCGPAWRAVPTREAVPGAKGQGYVHPAEVDWTSCNSDQECSILRLGGEPYCVDPRGVMAIRTESSRAAMVRYGAGDQELLSAPIELVTCAALGVQCLAHHCTLVEPVR